MVRYSHLRCIPVDRPHIGSRIPQQSGVHSRIGAAHQDQKAVTCAAGASAKYINQHRIYDPLHLQFTAIHARTCQVPIKTKPAPINRNHMAQQFIPLSII